jgi:hypothetical protein
MGAAGRARALQFAWPKVTDQVESYYEELAAGYGKHLPAY